MAKTYFTLSEGVKIPATGYGTWQVTVFFYCEDCEIHAEKILIALFIRKDFNSIKNFLY